MSAKTHGKRKYWLLAKGAVARAQNVDGDGEVGDGRGRGLKAKLGNGGQAGAKTKEDPLELQWR